MKLAVEKMSQQEAEAVQAERIDEDDTPDILDRLGKLLFGGPAAALP